MALIGSGGLCSKDMQNTQDLQPRLEKETIETNLIGSDAELEEHSDMNVGIVFEKDGENNVIGMIFSSPNDAYEFYNSYAFLHGFGIRIDKTFRNRITNEPYRKKYVCNKEGFKDLKCGSSSGEVKKRRRDLRTGCEAFLRISKSKDGRWLVDKFNDLHNHELTVTPTKVMKHRSHAKHHRSKACKSLISELGRSGLKPCQIKKVVNTVKSPHDNDVTSKQCADILAEQRKEYKEREASADDLPKDLALIVTSCWKEDPNARPNFTQIIQMSAISPPESRPTAIPPRIFASQNAVFSPDSPGTSTLIAKTDESKKHVSQLKNMAEEVVKLGINQTDEQKINPM